MSWLTLGILLLLLFQHLSSASVLDASISNFHQSQRVKRDIPECPSPLFACSFIQDRIWYPPSTTPLCRCKNSACPNKWSTTPNKYTINYNGRAQFKFCSPVGTMETCNSHQLALVRTEILQHDKAAISIEIKCFCPPYHHYEYRTSNSSFRGAITQLSEWYTCKKLRQCKSGEFCGHITADKFQTYYICSCPQKHMCINNEKKKFTVKELLYDGEAYKGSCTSTK